MVFYVPLKLFHLYGQVSISGERLQNQGLSSAVTSFEQGKIFIVPHLLCPKEHVPHLVVLYDKQEDLFEPGSLGSFNVSLVLLSI